MVIYWVVCLICRVYAVDVDALLHSTLPLVRVNASLASQIQEAASANASSTLSNTTFADIEKDNLTLSLQMRYRERKKQERISLIRNQILSRLHLSDEPNITGHVFSKDDRLKIAEFMQQITLHDHHHMQWMQSFYPACTVPNSTDRAAWEETGSFRFWYDVPFSRYSNAITVMAAKLRLFQRDVSVGPTSVPRHNLLDGLVNYRLANGINVNVYQFFRPLKTNKREKKRLVDSRTISASSKGWVEFDVLTSLNFWLRHGTKNFGFDVEVEDAFGNKLNPNVYFYGMNCSTEIARDTPFPNIMDLHRDVRNESSSSLFDNETFPTLDLRTAEMPLDHKERTLSKRNVDACAATLEYVVFAEVGLDEYIVWPQGVVWAFCDGECGPRVNTPETREYFLSSLFPKLFQRKTTQSSSCVVTRRDSMTAILYDGDNQVFETTLQDFVPTDCGCRAS